MAYNLRSLISPLEQFEPVSLWREYNIIWGDQGFITMDLQDLILHKHLLCVFTFLNVHLRMDFKNDLVCFYIPLETQLIVTNFTFTLFLIFYFLCFLFPGNSLVYYLYTFGNVRYLAELLEEIEVERQEILLDTLQFMTDHGPWYQEFGWLEQELILGDLNAIARNRMFFKHFFRVKPKSAPFSVSKHLRLMGSALKNSTLFRGLFRFSYKAGIMKSYWGLLRLKSKGLSSRNNLYFQGAAVNMADTSFEVLEKKAKDLDYELCSFLAVQEDRGLKFISGIYVFFAERLYIFVMSVVIENINTNNRSIDVSRFFPFIFVLFVFILSSNLLGLLPYVSTVTSHAVVTIFLAGMVIVGSNYIAFKGQGLGFLGKLIPKGCPFDLYFLIIPIEAISHGFKGISLSTRLFANMMAGHSLLAVLGGLAAKNLTEIYQPNTELEQFAFFYQPLIPGFLALLASLCLVYLEVAVAVIQAYVFMVMSCMYISESLVGR